MDVVLSFLLSFPFNLIFVFLIYYLFNNKYFNYYYFTSLLLLGVFFFFSKQDLFFLFWSYNGAFTLFLFTYCFLYFNNLTSKSIEIYPLTDIKKVRSQLISIINPSEKEVQYLNLCKEEAKTLNSIHDILQYKTTIFWVATTFGITIIQSIVLFIKYYANTSFSLLAHLKSDIQKIIPEKVFPKTLFNTMVDYYPIITLLSYLLLANSVIIFLKFIITFKKENRHLRPWVSDAYYFKLPDFTILLFLPILILASIRLGFKIINPTLDYILLNTISIFGIIYLLNGLSILFIFLRVRLLPSRLIIIITLITGFFLKEFLFLCLFSLVIVGILDFVFNLRKKALHSIPIRRL